MSVQDLYKIGREVSKADSERPASKEVGEAVGVVTPESLRDLSRRAIAKTAGNIFGLCSLVESKTGHRAVDVYGCISSGKQKGGDACKQVLEDIDLALKEILGGVEVDEIDEESEDDTSEELRKLFREILHLEGGLDEKSLFEFVEIRSGYAKETIRDCLLGRRKRGLKRVKVIAGVLEDILAEIKGDKVHEFREFHPEELSALVEEILSLDMEVNKSNLLELVGRELGVSRPSVSGYVSGQYSMESALRRGVARKIGFALEKILEEAKANNPYVSVKEDSSKTFTQEELQALVEEINRVNSAVSINTILMSKLSCSRGTIHRYINVSDKPRTEEGRRTVNRIGIALEETLAELKADVFAFTDHIAVRRDQLKLFLDYFGSVNASARHLGISSSQTTQVHGKGDTVGLTREQWANVLELWKKGGNKGFTLT